MNMVHWLRAQWDRALAVGLFLASGACLMVSWIGVRHQALTALQVPYIVSGGIGAVVLIGLGGTLWISADLRDEWRAIDELRRHIVDESSS
jgi:hypothetical protein